MPEELILSEQKIENSQENNKCRPHGDWDKVVNNIESECIGLVQKEYENRYDWLGKVIHWELCKRLKFDLSDKSTQENET